MVVMVFSGTVQIDEWEFDNEDEALAFADEWQDQGFKVRISYND